VRLLGGNSLFSPVCALFAMGTCGMALQTNAGRRVQIIVCCQRKFLRPKGLKRGRAANKSLIACLRSIAAPCCPKHY
jgi:hypothetical protein